MGKGKGKEAWRIEAGGPVGALLGGGGPAWGVSLEMSCQAVKRHNLNGKRRA